MLPCGYHRYYYIEDEMLKHSIEEYEQGETRAQVVKETEGRLFELYKDPKLDYKPKELEERGGTHYSDAPEMIASIIMINEQIWLFLLKIMGQLLIYRMIVL